MTAQEVETGGFEASPGKKLARPYLQNKPDMAVPATWQTEIGGSWFEA
jgi:hypothetical protein